MKQVSQDFGYDIELTDSLLSINVDLAKKTAARELLMKGSAKQKLRGWAHRM